MTAQFSAPVHPEGSPAVIPLRQRMDEDMCVRNLSANTQRVYLKRTFDTVFGPVTFRSVRIVSCPCESQRYLEVAYIPMGSHIPERATPELLALQAKLSARMPYRQVVTTMREFLPVSASR
jgi:hypothetical protein